MTLTTRILAICVASLLVAAVGLEFVFWYDFDDSDSQTVQDSLAGGVRLAVQQHEQGANSDQLTQTFGYPVLPQPSGSVPAELQPWLAEDGLVYDGWYTVYAETSDPDTVLVFGPLPDWQFDWHQRALVLLLTALALGLAVWAVLRREQRQAEARQLLFQGASHELKTPIARLRFGIALLADAETAQDRTRHATRLDADLADLATLVDELLEHARADQIAPDVRRRPLSDLVPDAPGDADYDLATMARALANLTRNAEQHAETVQVSVDGDVRVHVDDDGPGVPPADRERLLAPFARGADGGHGLGLAIADRIAQAHGGRLVLSESPLGGLRATLEWPRHTR